MSKNPSSYRVGRLLSLALPHRWSFLVAMIALAGGSVVNLCLPAIIKELLDGRLAAIAAHNFDLVGLGLFAIFALQGVCAYLRSYLFSIIGLNVVADLRRKLYEALLYRDIEFFDLNRSGDLTSRLGSDTILIQDAVSIKLSVFIRYSFQVAVGIVLMCLISVRLSLAIVVSLPILVGLSVILGRRLRVWSKRQQAELGLSTSIAEEAFSGIRTVKSFLAEPREAERYGASVERTREIGYKRTALSAFSSSFVSFLMNATILVVLLYGIKLVQRNELTAGDLTAFLLYGIIVAVSFAFVTSGWSDFLQSLGAAERIFEIIDSSAKLILERDGAIRKHAASLPDPVLGGVDFQGVSFEYPSRLGVQVLNEVQLSIPSGKTTALVGPSGAGKSTIVSLILGFYQPTLGKVKLDGVDLAALSVTDLRRVIGVVPQEPILFGVSIAENLRYGKPTATVAELEEACRKSNILDFVRSLPQGFDTDAGTRGTQLSAGQKQRISIARAMLKDPALLILDEATSALDSENEALVQEALTKLMTGRTCLVIAHRLSTIKNADGVVVVEAGKVIQTGSHESLSRETGLYRQLVERQELTSAR